MSDRSSPPKLDPKETQKASVERHDSDHFPPTSSKPRPLTKLERRAILKNVFRHFHDNPSSDASDRPLTPEELRHALETSMHGGPPARHHHISDWELSRMIAEVDTNRDKKVSFEEFERAFGHLVPSGPGATNLAGVGTVNALVRTKTALGGNGINVSEGAAGDNTIRMDMKKISQKVLRVWSDMAVCDLGDDLTTTGRGANVIKRVPTISSNSDLQRKDSGGLTKG